MHRLSFIVSISLISALAACSTSPSPNTAQRDPQAPAPPTQLIKCDVAPVQALVGQTGNEVNIQKIKLDSGSKDTRVLGPGMAATMDYREDRVNIDVDAGNTITAIRCG